MDLLQHTHGRGILLYQSRITDLHILDMTLLVFTADPEECIFIESDVGKILIFQIAQGTLQIAADILVFNLPHVDQIDLIRTCHTFCKYIAINIQLLQVCKHCLGIF